MRNNVKRYILNDNIENNLLEKNGFKKGGFLSEIPSPKYYYNKNIMNELLLHIEINIDSAGIFNFDDFDNVIVLDDMFGQPYYSQQSVPWE